MFNNKESVEDVKNNITAMILAGGLGSRLSHVVSDRSKAIAPVQGRPFLFYLLDQLADAGLRNVVLCTGYLSDSVHSALGDQWRGMSLRYSIEERPLGTGGALRLGLKETKSERLLILNGDSYCEYDLDELLEFDQSVSGMSMVSVWTEDVSRYGTLSINDSGTVDRFHEKQPTDKSGHINAGVYLIDRSWIHDIHTGRQVSLEKEMFPKWIDRGIHAFLRTDGFIDIGTPNDYSKAELFFSRIAERKAKAAKMFSGNVVTADTQIKCGAGVLVRNDKGEVLLEKRSDCSLWGCLGGRVDPGETITNAAIREVKEESGFDIVITGLFGIYSRADERIIAYPDNGDIRHLVDIILNAQIIGGEFCISPESEELRFFDVDNGVLPPRHLIIPPARRPLADLIEGRMNVID